MLAWIIACANGVGRQTVLAVAMVNNTGRPKEPGDFTVLLIDGLDGLVGLGRGVEAWI